MIDLKPYAQTLKHKKVGVFGLGLSGLASVKALVAADIKVMAWDDREDQRLEAQKFGADIEDISNTLNSAFDFLLLSPGVPLTHPEPHAVVKKAHENNVEIIGDIELLHCAGLDVKTIGITGTNGKSTTTTLMAHVLSSCGLKAVAAGNIGKAVLELNLDDVDILVLEMSSYQLDLCPSFHPDVSMLLNMSPDHLDRHGDMKNYRDVKAKIFEGIGHALIGIDDKYCSYVADQTDKKNERTVQRISVKEDADITVIEGVLFEGENQIGSLNDFDTLKGNHNYQNCAFVYAAAKLLNIDSDNILKAMSTYSGLPHRQYKVASHHKVTYINDSKATNAESAAKALSSYQNICWIVGGQAKEGGLTGLETYKDHINKAYVIGEAAPDFMPWFKEHSIQAEHSETLETATSQAHQDAQVSGDEATVLLAPACASWDQFKSFEHRGDVFVEAVQKLITECE